MSRPLITENMVSENDYMICNIKTNKTSIIILINSSWEEQRGKEIVGEQGAYVKVKKL